MARALRIQYPGACYHVMNRGAYKQKIFYHDEHYLEFLKLMSQAAKQFEVKFHAYCLMGNHYHLMLTTPLPNLSRVMRHINSVYTQHFNKDCKRDGALFRGRYKSILVQSDDYSYTLLRYIHLNPVTAGLVDSADEYRWSSVHYYLNDQSPTPKWLDLSVANQSMQKVLGHCDHRQYLTQVDADDLDDIISSKTKVPTIGDDDFIKAIQENHIGRKPSELEVPEHRATYLHMKPSIDQFVTSVAQLIDCPVEMLRSSRGRYRHPLRDLLIEFLAHEAQYKVRHIGEYFGLSSYTGLSRCIVRGREEKEEKADVYQQVIDLWYGMTSYLPQCTD